MSEAKAVVEKANARMAQLTDAIAEITRSSEETGKIIKTIDDLAAVIGVSRRHALGTPRVASPSA